MLLFSEERKQKILLYLNKKKKKKLQNVAFVSRGRDKNILFSSFVNFLKISLFRYMAFHFRRNQLARAFDINHRFLQKGSRSKLLFNGDCNEISQLQRELWLYGLLIPAVDTRLTIQRKKTLIFTASKRTKKKAGCLFA